MHVGKFAMFSWINRFLCSVWLMGTRTIPCEDTWWCEQTNIMYSPMWWVWTWKYFDNKGCTRWVLDHILSQVTLQPLTDFFPHLFHCALVKFPPLVVMRRLNKWQLTPKQWYTFTGRYLNEWTQQLQMAQACI